MFGICALYRGRTQTSSEYVHDIASALDSLTIAENIQVHEDTEILLRCADAESATILILNILQAKDFSLGIGAIVGEEDPDSFQVIETAQRCTPRHNKAGILAVRLEEPGSPQPLNYGAYKEVAADIAAAFILLSHILGRRTEQGRQATALMRQGYSQSEAADLLGITKQAMSQRLSAAAWEAERAGWDLAVHMLSRVDQLAQ